MGVGMRGGGGAPEFTNPYYLRVTCLLAVLYTIIYYYAGGTDPNGNTWIYPNLDWADPGPTTGMVFASAAMLLALHIVTVLISLARDWCCRRYVRDDKSMSFN